MKEMRKLLFAIEIRRLLNYYLLQISIIVDVEGQGKKFFTSGDYVVASVNAEPDDLNGFEDTQVFVIPSLEEHETIQDDYSKVLSKIRNE